MRELHGKWTANHNDIGAVFLDELWETEGDTAGDIGVGCFAANRGGLATVVSADGVTRGDIFPFGGFIVVNIVGMARFNRGGIFGEFARSG